MKIAILGAGAMGSLLGFYLSGVEGHTIWLLDGWAAHVRAMQERGLSCEREGRSTTRAVRATTAADEIGPCDVIIVLVKAHQNAWAATQCRALAQNREPRAGHHSAPLVITLQNGVGNREALAEALPGVTVSQGVTTLGATLLGPGQLRHAGMGPTYFAQLPQPDPASQSPLLELVHTFTRAGLPAELRDDVETLVWSKLVVNVGINALTALLRVPNGTLATLAPARILVERLVAEALVVAAARGTPLPGDPLAQVFAVAEATAANRSSTLQDVLRGSPSEIAMINGAIVREGERLGVPTPYNRIVTELVQALDAAAGQHAQGV